LTSKNLNNAEYDKKQKGLTNDRTIRIKAWMCQNIQIYTAYTIKILEGDKNKYDIPSYNRKNPRNKHHIQGYGYLQFR
jgi:hypothetical protein